MSQYLLNGEGGGGHGASKKKNLWRHLGVEIGRPCRLASRRGGRLDSGSLRARGPPKPAGSAGQPELHPALPALARRGDEEADGDVDGDTDEGGDADGNENGVFEVLMYAHYCTYTLAFMHTFNRCKLITCHLIFESRCCERRFHLSREGTKMHWTMKQTTPFYGRSY